MLDVGGDGHDCDFAHESDIIVGSSRKSARLQDLQNEKYTYKQVDRPPKAADRASRVYAGRLVCVERDRRGRLRTSTKERESVESRRCRELDEQAIQKTVPPAVRC